MENIVLFGCGMYGKMWLERLGKKNVLCFSDSDKSKYGKIINGKYVYDLSEIIKKYDDYNIFISTSEEKKNEIKKHIVDLGQEHNLVENPYDESFCRTNSNVYLDPTTIFEGNNYVGSSCDLYKSEIGYSTYISNNSSITHSKLGKYSAIGPNVQVIRGQHPTEKFVSIHPAFYSAYNPVTNIHYSKETLFTEFKYTDSGYAVEIGSDVWIGQDAMVMEGIKINNGAIIAAGAVVVKDVESYTIMAGIPAKKIRDRFKREEKDYLEKLQWWGKNQEWINKYSCYFYDISVLMNKVPIK